MRSYKREWGTCSGKVYWSPAGMGACASCFLGNTHSFRRLWALHKKCVLPSDGPLRALSYAEGRGLPKGMGCISTHRWGTHSPARCFSQGAKGLQGRRDGGLRIGPNSFLLTFPWRCPCLHLKTCPGSFCPQQTTSPELPGHKLAS